AQLLAAELAHLVLVRGRAALVDAQRLLDQLGRGRRLRDEAEAPVFEDGDLDGDDVAPLALRRSVVLLDEVHDVDAVRTEGGTDRRGGRGLASGKLDLDQGRDLLLRRHESFSGS